MYQGPQEAVRLDGFFDDVWKGIKTGASYVWNEIRTPSPNEIRTPSPYAGGTPYYGSQYPPSAPSAAGFSLSNPIVLGALAVVAVALLSKRRK